MKSVAVRTEPRPRLISDDAGPTRNRKSSQELRGPAQPMLINHTSKPAGSRSPAEPSTPDSGRKDSGSSSGPDPTRQQTLARSIARSAPSPARLPRLHLRLLGSSLFSGGLHSPVSRHPAGRLGSRSSAGASRQELRYPPLCWFPATFPRSVGFRAASARESFAALRSHRCQRRGVHR